MGTGQPENRPTALTPPLQYFDAIAKGAIDLAWTTPGYWYGKEKALVMFSSVPFGPSAGEYLAWFYYGGGEQLMDGIHKKHGLKSIICGMIAPEATGWFRKEIKTVADLKGLKMRFFGLGGRVMQKLGVATQLLAGGTFIRCWSAAPSMPQNIPCRPLIWISAFIRSRNITISPAGISNRHFWNF